MRKIKSNLIKETFPIRKETIFDPNQPQTLSPEPYLTTTSLFLYNKEDIKYFEKQSIPEYQLLPKENKITWLNINGRNKTVIDYLEECYKIHFLLIEDILSNEQRPKIDEINGRLLCLLNMLSYNKANGSFKKEQISIILGKDFLISVNETPLLENVFKPLRDKLAHKGSNLRLRQADYLFSEILDIIVDNYFLALKEVIAKIEALEDIVVKGYANKHTLTQISHFRKELGFLQRNILPVRDLLSSIIRSGSSLIEPNNIKYFKNILDHTYQLFDYTKTYKSLLNTLQDLYLNNITLKTNNIMKTLAIVTCLFAPVSALSSVYGMNLYLPFAKYHFTGPIFITCMIGLIIAMLIIFRRYKWY